VFLFSWLSIAGIGALMLVGALAWRNSRRSRMHTRIAAALDDDDPQRRRAGVLVATEKGLRAHADLLAEHLDREQDPDVLATLAEGVLRNSWEPADRPAILRLRLWANEERSAAGLFALPRPETEALDGQRPPWSPMTSGAEPYGGLATALIPVVRESAPTAGSLFAPRPATQHRRSRPATGRRAVAGTAGDAFVPSPRPAVPSDGDGPPPPRTSGPMIPAPRRELGRSQQSRLEPVIPVVDRRARRAAARRAAAVAAVTPAATAPPVAESFPERIDDVAPDAPMSMPRPSRSRRPQIDAPILSPRRRGTLRDVQHRSAGAPTSTLAVELAAPDHDDRRGGLRPWFRSRRPREEPRHRQRRQAQLAAVAPATEPEPEARRGARHRTEPGQLRFVRGDI
jgi:hypothetical protein